MHSDFLDKFKGKTNKVSKSGFSDLVQRQGKIHLKPNLSKQTLINKVELKQGDKKNKNKRQKNNQQNKQNKRTKIVSHNVTQLKNKKRNIVVHQRQAHVSKQMKKHVDKDFIIKEQALKLPTISKEKKQRQKPHYFMESIRQAGQKNTQADNNRKHIMTQTKEQKGQKINLYASYLDDDAAYQLKKLNQFEHLVIQRQVQKSLNLDQLFNSKVSHHNYRKGLSAHH